MASIELLPATVSADGALVAALADWSTGSMSWPRTDCGSTAPPGPPPDETAALIAAGEIAVARDGGPGGRIVGSVGVQRLDDATRELGMPVADPDRRGEGIGRDRVSLGATRTDRGQGDVD
jgi:hypothetical protein